MNYKIASVNKLLKFRKRFTFVYGGGGLFCGLWNYDAIEKIFLSPYIDLAVILPSTFYNCKDIIKLFDERFIIFCRDVNSFTYCKSLNKKATFLLSDDMALSADLTSLKKVPVDNSSLLKKLVGTRSLKKGKILYAFRKDRESLVDFLPKDNFDLSSCYPNGDFLNPVHTNFLAAFFVQTIDSYDEIHTDRLHIGIVSALLGKKTILHDNVYGKVRAVYNFSLKDFSNVEMPSR